MALEKTKASDGAFVMYPSKSGVMNTARYHKEVQDGVRLNVVWAAVTEELERDALPVRTLCWRKADSAHPVGSWM